MSPKNRRNTQTLFEIVPIWFDWKTTNSSIKNSLWGGLSGPQNPAPKVIFFAERLGAWLYANKKTFIWSTLASLGCKQVGGIVYLSAVFLLLKDMYHEKSQLYMGENKNMLQIFWSFISPLLKKHYCNWRKLSSLEDVFFPHPSVTHPKVSSTNFSTLNNSKLLIVGWSAMTWSICSRPLKSCKVALDAQTCWLNKKGPRFKSNGNSAKAKHLFDFLFGGGVVVLLKQKTYESLEKNDS